MRRLQRLIELIPELVGQGLLDASGGNLAVRTSQGVYISPTQAGEQLRWQVHSEDFVLFPGEGDASMGRAGRRPSRETRVHRAVLVARPDWNFVYHGHPWGLLSFALAEKPLPLSAAHAHLIQRGKARQIPVTPPIPGGAAQLTEHVTRVMTEEFAGCPHGAVLLGGHGPLVAGVELESTLSLITDLENVARAQQWQLARD